MPDKKSQTTREAELEAALRRIKGAIDGEGDTFLEIDPREQAMFRLGRVSAMVDLVLEDG